MGDKINYKQARSLVFQLVNNRIKTASFTSELLSNTAWGGVAGNLLGSSIGYTAGDKTPKSMAIGTLLGASSGALATVVDYIHKKRGKYYYIDDNRYH